MRHAKMCYTVTNQSRVPAPPAGSLLAQAESRYVMSSPHSSAAVVNAASTSWRTRVARVADRFGATASFLCALHCALLPFVAALLPFLGLSFLANHTYERVFVLFACTLASTTIGLGARRHGDRRALALLLPGIGLLLAGIAVDFDSLPVLHAILVSTGGTLLSLAHVANLRLTHVHDANCAH